MEGNQYFEQQVNKFIRSVSTDELIRRSKECREVVDHIENDIVWQIVLQDCKRWVTQLDAHWQEVYDENQLKQMRILKYAYNHLFSLPNKYVQELKQVTEEIEKRDNAHIDKDYDAETNLE